MQPERWKLDKEIDESKWKYTKKLQQNTEYNGDPRPLFWQIHTCTTQGEFYVVCLNQTKSNILCISHSEVGSEFM